MRAVALTKDFERIRDLPVREITKERIARDNANFTKLLATPKGLAAGVALMGLQGFVLRELCELGGSYSGIPVGGGKTLVSFLAPTVVEAKRPLLVIPAALREKTAIEFAKYAEHWQAPRPAPMVRSYTDFTDENALDLFEQLAPDFVMCDEAHKSSNHTGSFAKRFARWKVKSGCKCWFASGTGTRFAISNFSHLLIWALEDGAPVPLDLDESEAWGSAIDERQAFGTKARRTRVGKLLELNARVPERARAITQLRKEREAAGHLWSDLALSRLAFQDRLRHTPGVVIVDDDSCDQPLTIRMTVAPEDEELNGWFDRYLNDSEELPDCLRATDTVQIYAKQRELGCGMYYRWDPMPPEEWLAARRAYTRFVRAKVLSSASSPYPLDTPEAVKKRFRDHPIVCAWAAIEKSFKLNSVPVWLSGSVVQHVTQRAHQAPTLVWCGIRAVGDALAQVSGFKYYGADGRAQDGSSIEHAPADRSAILSIAANSTGRNLQRFHRNLIVGGLQSALDNEQLLGRTHRYGQTRPVEVEVLATSGLSEYAWKTALREASFVLTTQGQRQKILRAQFTPCNYPSGALRWSVKGGDK